MADPQQQAQLTLEQFGQKIKSKYPQYQSLSDTDIANKVLAKYPQYKSSVRQNGGAGGSWEPQTLREKFSTIEKPDPSKPWALSEAGKALSNVAKGAIAPILHPIDAAKGMIDLVTNPIPTAATMAQQFTENPYGFIEAGLGQAALGRVGAEVAPRVYKAATPLAGDAVRSMTGTAPRTLKPLVESTEKTNAGIAESNAKQLAARADEVRAFHDKTQAAKTAAETRSAAETRKAGLQSGSNKLGDQFQTDLRSLRDSEASKAGAKFNSLNAALDAEPAQTVFLPNALSEAMEKIKGSDTEPTILRDMERKIAEPMTYRDLQGYYSELGRELQKGTLAGDVYHAYSTLQDAVGDEMQRIAESKGLGAELSDARQSWRNLKQTFYDPKSPLRKSLDAKEPGGSVKALAGKDRTGIEALAKYDPKLAQRANTIRGYAEQAGATKVPAASTKTAPELGPKPQPAPLKNIDVGDIQDAKAESLAKRAEHMRGSHSPIVSSIAAYDAIRSAIEGNWKRVALDLGARALYGAGKSGIARLLEQPSITEFLTRATAKDVAAIPPDLRGPMAQLISQAKSQGINVSPELARAGAGTMGVAPRKYPSDVYADGH
jgi:hypothetical protein